MLCFYAPLGERRLLEAGDRHHRDRAGGVLRALLQEGRGARMVLPKRLPLPYKVLFGTKR